MEEVLRTYCDHEEDIRRRIEEHAEGGLPLAELREILLNVVDGGR